MTRKKALPCLFFIFVIFLGFRMSVYSEDYTLSDVVAAQKEGTEDITTMSATVESEVVYDGINQPLAYDYIMKQDEYGNVKMMVTSRGIFQMQFLTDTSDMSVTYLMGNGETKKYTLTEDMKKEIESMAGINGASGGNVVNSMYAFAGGLKNTVTDAVYAGKLDTNELETSEQKISVRARNRWFGKRYGEVEYINKNVEKSKKEWEEAIDKLRNAKPKNEKGKKVRERAVGFFEKKKEKVLDAMVARRVEKINMKTGMVEEQEMYNLNGKKVGWFKVKDKKKINVKARGNKIKELVVAAETEGEMAGAFGKSRIKTKVKNIQMNKPVEFKWMDVKKLRKKNIEKRKKERKVFFENLKNKTGGGNGNIKN